jgi:hypothetical protein
MPWCTTEADSRARVRGPGQGPRDRYGQSDGRRAAERFLARYNEIGGLRPGDYATVTRNASYIGLLLAAGRE